MYIYNIYVYICIYIYIYIYVLYAPIHIYIHYLLLFWSLNKFPILVVYARLTFNGLLFICLKSLSPNCFLVALLKANAPCQEGVDMCGPNLLCTRCGDSQYTDVVCQSGTLVC